MTDTDKHRRRRIPPLAIIVVALLVLLGVIAVLRSGASVVSPDSGVSIPVDIPDDAVMPNPQPPAPPIPRPS